MSNTPSYIEIGSKDAKTTSRFFAEVFDWKYSKMGEDNGWFQTPTIRAGLHGNDPNPQMYVFFAVPDLRRAIEMVRSAGGQAEEPGPEEPGFGVFSNCQDPTGLLFGLHEVPSN